MRAGIHLPQKSLRRFAPQFEGGILDFRGGFVRIFFPCVETPVHGLATSPCQYNNVPGLALSPNHNSSLAPQAQQWTAGQLASPNDIHTSEDCFSTGCERPFMKQLDKTNTLLIYSISPLEEEDISPLKCLQYLE